MPGKKSFDINEGYIAETNLGEEEVDTAVKDISPASPANIYVGKRNFIHQLMDVALLMANVSQLNALLSMKTSDKYFYPLLVFICLSMTLQVVFTLCMLWIWSLEHNTEKHMKEASTADVSENAKLKRVEDRIDNVGNVLVLLIIISNVMITGFGVESHG